MALISQTPKDTLLKAIKQLLEPSIYGFICSGLEKSSSKESLYELTCLFRQIFEFDFDTANHMMTHTSWEKLLRILEEDVVETEDDDLDIQSYLIWNVKYMLGYKPT